jgi:CRP/FNR family transcriptional regulator, cyclic AMP receptor protein
MPATLEKERAVAKRSDAVELLSQVPLFSELTNKELAAIARATKEVHHKPGRVLAKEGDSGIGFFLIVDGTAKVTVNGRKRAKLTAGDFFGEISLLDGGPRTATVTAETPMTLLGLTQWVFKRLVEQNPAIATKVLRVMAQRLRATPAGLTQ